MHLHHNQKLLKLFYDHFVKLSDIQHSYAAKQKRNIVYFKPCIKNKLQEKGFYVNGVQNFEKKTDHSLKSIGWLSYKNQYEKEYYFPDMNKINWVLECYHDFLQNNCKNAIYYKLFVTFRILM